VANSVYSARNIYVINGRICFLTMYDKTQKQRSNTDYIMRYVPQEVGRLLAEYLVYVRPFARALDRQESEYLFGDARGPWAGEELTQALGPITSKELGVRLTTQSYRQVAIGIATRKLMRASRIWEKDDGNIDADEQAAEFAEGDDQEELQQDTFRHVVVRQAGHGRRVAQAHYAIDGAFLHRLGPELITAFEQASVAWHQLWGLGKDHGSSSGSGIGHRRDASQQLAGPLAKRERVGDTIDARTRALTGLQRIYQNPNAQPRSEGQAAALELVHDPSPTVPLVIVLPTSSGKSALFFSVAAMASQQTVIVVVPFASLVDDIIIRGEAAGLDCEEWRDEKSGHELRQLVVVSADRAVQGEFLHYAKGLELHGQLAHVFFDECHVAFTDTSYRERLRELWTLRYLNCPFTGLTATLMVALEEVLRERLCIGNAVVFRRRTARPTIRYQVIDSGPEEPASVRATRLVQGIQLLPGKRGVVYVRSYATGKALGEALQCPFYKAQASDKGELLREWIEGPGGWIVATGALGTGINIEGIVWVVHVDRPYGLTSFVQQSGRGGRNGEVSESVVVTRIQHSQGYKRRALLSEYSVEQVDEDAMTGFIQAQRCRREVLSCHFDSGAVGDGEAVDCYSTGSVMCDWCQTQRTRPGLGQQRSSDSSGGQDQESSQASQASASTSTSVVAVAAAGAQLIGQRLRTLQEQDESLIRAMDQLQKGCIYCQLIHAGDHGEILSQGISWGQLHTYAECADAEANQCGFVEYEGWRRGIDLGQFQHCWRCGLSQEIC
jgi:superfamily II DNA helicase RecQ